MFSLALRASMRAVSALALCSSLTGCVLWDDFKLVSTGPEQATGRYDKEKASKETQSIKDFISDWTGIHVEKLDNLGGDVGTDAADGLLASGHIHVRATCNDLFIHLERFQKDIGTVSTDLALAGTAATALLAITGAGLPAAGIAGAATAYAVGSTEALGKNLLYDLPVGATSILVRDAQERRYQQALGTKRNYADAFVVIQEMAYDCTPSGIEALVTQEMVRRKIQADTGNENLDKLHSMAADLELKDTARSLDVKSISHDEASALYAVFILGDHSDPVLAAAHDKIKANAELDKVIFGDPVSDPPKIVIDDTSNLLLGLSNAKNQDENIEKNAKALIADAKAAAAAAKAAAPAPKPAIVPPKAPGGT